MGNRLSKIYTRTGDSGTTAVSDGIRISKSHPRIAVLGALDKLNAHVGLLLCEDLPEIIRNQLEGLQHRLFDIGGEISMPELSSVQQIDTEQLEHEIDSMNQELKPLKEFILPGGSRASALSHILRTECRSTESLLVALHDYDTAKPVRSEILAFINRLSDWFFVAGRFVLLADEKPEILWKNPYSRK